MTSSKRFGCRCWLTLAACVLVGCGGANKSPAPVGNDAGPDHPTPAGNDAGPESAPPDVPEKLELGTDLSLDGDDARLPGPDAGEAANPILLDAGDAPDGPSIDLAGETGPAAACTTPLLGTAPFGASLSGLVTFISTSTRPPSTAQPSSRTVTAYVYFPAGRVAGAPVLLGMPSPAIQGQHFFGAQVTLAADLSATGLTVGGHDMMVTGNLLPGTGGLQAAVSANFASLGDDVVDDRSGTALLCPAGDAPAASLQVWTTAVAFSPLSSFSVNAAAPITTDAMKALRISSAQGPVPFTVSPDSMGSWRWASGPSFTIAPSTAFPPGQPLSFDATSVKDVLGRDVKVTLSTTQVLATTDVLSDLTFATAPPSGAAACSGCTASAFPVLDGGTSTAMSRCTGGGTVAGGLLKIVAGQFTGRNVEGLFALPGTAATKLRVRMVVGDIVAADASLGCMNGYSSARMRTATIAVVGPNGESSPPVSLSCDGILADHLIDLPAASPLWLAVHVEADSQVPYSMPVPGPPTVTIDEIELM